MPSATSRPAVAVGLALLLLTSGCTLLPADSGDESIGTDAAESYAAVDGLSAVMEIETVRGNETTTVRARMQMRPGDEKIRQRILAPEAQAGNVFVSNGSVAWSYNATRNSVTRTRIDRSDNESQSYGEFVQRLFNSVNDERGTADGTSTRTVGVSSLPVVPDGGAAESPASPDGTLEDYDVTYHGTETVDGRTAHVVHLTPRPSQESITGNQTLWIDATHYVPLKIHQVTTVNGESVERTVVFRNVTINPGLSPDTFRFDPPENATVEKSSISSSTYDNRSAAVDEVEFSAPDPDLPRGFELDRAKVTETRNVTSLILVQTNGTHDLRIVKQSGNATWRDRPVNRENVSISGKEGFYNEFGETGIVSWRCGKYTYAVTGKLPKAALVEIATSMACE